MLVLGLGVAYNSWYHLQLSVMVRYQISDIDAVSSDAKKPCALARGSIGSTGVCGLQ